MGRRKRQSKSAFLSSLPPWAMGAQAPSGPSEELVDCTPDFSSQHVEQGSIYCPPRLRVAPGVLTPLVEQILMGVSSAGGRETSGWK